MGNLSASSMNRIRKSMDINLIGSLQMVKAAAPALKEAGGGSVVLRGSARGRSGCSSSRRSATPPPRAHC
ncbi:MAG: hypothetical protein V9G12_07705 [Microthrixaceae bacterium]